MIRVSNFVQVHERYFPSLWATKEYEQKTYCL